MSESESESDASLNPETPELKGRTVGGTEYSWCKAVPTGTGITVLGLLLSKPPDIPLLQNTLHELQNSHPILRSTLHFDPTVNTFSFLTPSTPHLKIQPFDLTSTSRILQNYSHSHSVTPFHLILEHELNQNTWHDPNQLHADKDVFFASIYTVTEAQWALMLRLHTSACDRTAAVSLRRELLGSLLLTTGNGKEEGEGIEWELGDKGEVNLGIEELIPAGKANKRFWARGIDMLSYSLNSLKLANLDFRDVDSPRFSKVVRLQMTSHHTHNLLADCQSRGIKLCAALVAAGLIAAHSSKLRADNQQKKYGVATLIDCRSILDPALSSHHFGFYHAAILNSHTMKGGEKLWDLAQKAYMTFANSKNSNKHFSDMSDLNLLMCKAIENPGLTASSSLRTSFMSVFEDTVIDHSSNEMQQVVGLEEYISCASVHGVSPSIAIFDTIRDGRLDCVCVYPAPLHSREQMVELIDYMKALLVDAGNLCGM